MKKYALSLLSFVLAVLMVLCVGVTALAVNSSLYRGDANLDETVNVKDATSIQKHVALIEKLIADAYLCADVNSDGDLSVKDATAIQKYVAGVDDPYDIGSVLVKTPETTATDTTVPTEAQEEKMNTKITIYFSNNVGWKNVHAYIYNSSNDIEKTAWPGDAMTLLGTNDFGEQIYKLDVDVSAYNRVVFNNTQSQSMNAALSVASSGFFIQETTPKNGMPLGLYTYGETDYGTVKQVSFDYPAADKNPAYKKPIYIWTPKGYDASDKTKKYPVIYLLDGQNQFLDDAALGGWGSDEVITSLVNNGGKGAILVGIDNCSYRDNELTPDLGELAPGQLQYGDFATRTGEQFANFVANKVVPYVNANYNTSTEVKDNYIIGSSSGGIEAFYIGMEYMDIFGGIGALSPAFMLFEKPVWDAYLSKFDFSDVDKLPLIYFYNGAADPLERELLPYAEAMPQWLETLGYPAEKMTFVYEDTFSHNEHAWRCMMPEIVAWLMDLQ